MYAIYDNIYHQYTPEMLAYIPYMDPMGIDQWSANWVRKTNKQIHPHHHFCSVEVVQPGLDLAMKPLLRVLCGPRLQDLFFGMKLYHIIMCIYIHIYISYIWVNSNDLTATSLESWLIRGIIPNGLNSGLWIIIICPDIYYISHTYIYTSYIHIHACVFSWLYQDSRVFTHMGVH